MDQVLGNVRGVFIAVSAGGASPAVLLDAGPDTCIPIFIGLWEAISINTALNNEVPPRPLTHDLFIDFMGRFQITMRSLHIDSLDDGVFYAKMILDHADREEVLDCRPSDGIAIALRCNAGIYLDQSVIESSSVKTGELPDFIGLNSYLYG
jgi:uncharacterized protein